MKDQLSGLISSIETVTTERDNLQEERDKHEAEMNQKLEASMFIPQWAEPYISRFVCMWVSVCECLFMAENCAQYW